MKPLTHEWVNKAEGDFATEKRELRASDFPNYDAVCFQAQQCVEKYQKARLQEANIPFGKSHNLSILLDLLLPEEPSWVSMRPQLRTLNAYAVEFRYPGESADKSMAQQAVEICTDLRSTIRKGLGLDS